VNETDSLKDLVVGGRMILEMNLREKHSTSSTQHTEHQHAKRTGTAGASVKTGKNGYNNTHKECARRKKVDDARGRDEIK
jgi:hypothetical protein